MNVTVGILLILSMVIQVAGVGVVTGMMLDQKIPVVTREVLKYLSLAMLAEAFLMVVLLVVI